MLNQLAQDPVAKQDLVVRFNAGMNRYGSFALDLDDKAFLETAAAKDPFAYAAMQVESDWSSDLDDGLRFLSDNTVKDDVKTCQKQFVKEIYGLDPDNPPKKTAEEERQWREGTGVPIPMSLECGPVQRCQDIYRGEGGDEKFVFQGRDWSKLDFNVTRDAILDLISDGRKGDPDAPKKITPNVKNRVQNALDYGLHRIVQRLEEKACEQHGSKHTRCALEQLERVYEIVKNESQHFKRHDRRSGMSATQKAHLKVLKEVYLNLLNKYLEKRGLGTWSPDDTAILNMAKGSPLLKAQRGFFKPSLTASQRSAQPIINELEAAKKREEKIVEIVEMQNRGTASTPGVGSGGHDS